MKKGNFSAEFTKNANPTQLVVNQNFYGGRYHPKAMDVGLSTMTDKSNNCVMSIRSKTPKASLMTPEQIERRIRELRKKRQRIEIENEILEKGYCRFNLSMQHNPFNYLFRCF